MGAFHALHGSSQQKVDCAQQRSSRSPPMLAHAGWPHQQPVAPPATVWEDWCAATASTATASTATAAAGEAAPAATATTAAATTAVISLPSPTTAPMTTHLHHAALSAVTAHVRNMAAASSSSSTGSSGGSFASYAAAVLAGLPADDEAVHLAALAAAQGRDLQDVLLSAAHQASGSNGGGRGCASIPPAGVLMTKDPRSGRLSVVPPVGGSAGAAALYGDLARWADPVAIEATLSRGRARAAGRDLKRPRVGR